MSRRLSSESSSCDEESLSKYPQFRSPTLGKHTRLSVSTDGATASEDEAKAVQRPVHNFYAEKRSHPSVSTDGGSEDDDEDEDDEEEEDTDEPPQKKAKGGLGGYSSVAQRMMARMGHQEGTGLGSSGKGIVEPIQAEMRMGKRGLGFSMPGFEHTGDDYIEEEDGKYLQPTIHETIGWAPPCTDPIPTLDELASWFREGPIKLEIEDETHFCNGAILSNVLKAKSAFDKLESFEFLKARTRANPYELIKGGIFQNRAAMKMANIDKVCNFMFSYPKSADGSDLLKKTELLYFADICSGPGGFSEYVLWRRGQDMAKGFGFTLKSGPGVNDFKLEEFFSAPVEFFEPHYGVGGASGNGDIMDSGNIEAFRNFVLESTGNCGVHFVMGDGGFSVEGQENIQEILTKQLVLCQFCMALSILRPGGHFLCKIFDIFTPFTVGLFYLLWRCFDRVALCKPITSRPANSERYVVCQGLREGADVIFDYMFNLNVRCNELKVGSQANDILEVVPLQLMKETAAFSTYVREFNESFGKAQVNALRRLAAYVRNSTLCVPDQAGIRSDCLKEWKVPDEARAAPQRLPPSEKISNLQATKEAEAFKMSCCSPDDANMEVIERRVTSLDDWYCYISCGQRLMLLSLGRSNIYALTKHSRGEFVRSPGLSKLLLPANTLIEVELVEELKGEGKGQFRVPTVYIVDALFLYGKDMRKRHYEQRLQYADKMVRALSSPSRTDLMTVRVNSGVKLSKISTLFERLSMKRMKGRAQPRLAFSPRGHDQICVCPEGVVFMRHLSSPWTQLYSKSRRKPYFCNPSLKESVFDCPADAIGDYYACTESKFFWQWGRDNVQQQQEIVSSAPPSAAASGLSLTRSALLAYVDSKKVPV